MLTCVIIAANLYIADTKKLFPTQGSYYFLKQQHSIVVYTETKRISSLSIPKEFQADTVHEVFKLCAANAHKQ